jgi:tetratricopeptide (TPR) repeat protein
MTSWLPIEMPISDFKTLLHTFHSVFPHVYIWTAASHPNKHALLVGSDEPLQIDVECYVERFEKHARSDLGTVYLGDAATFLACHRATMSSMGVDIEGLPLNTEDLPILQYLGSRPELFDATKRRRLISGCLRLISAHPDPVTGRLAGVDRLPDPGGFLARVRVADEATAHVLRGIGLEGVDMAGAFREFELARRIMPEHPLFVAQRERSDEADPRVEAGIDLATADLEEVKREGYTRLREGAYGRALAAFQEWSRREPEAAEPVARMGVCFLNMGNRASAAAQFEAALAIDERSATAHLGIGLVHLGSGDAEAAVRHLSRAVALKPDLAGARARLGLTLAALGREDAAIAQLERAAALEPMAPDVHAALARLLVGRGDYDGAVKHLKALTDIRPDLPQAYSELADVYARLGRPESARRYAERAAELEAMATPESGNPAVVP